MASDAARFALSASARADDEVVTAGAQSGDHVFDECRIIGAVAIHEDDDVGIVSGLRAHEARPAIATAGIEYLGAGAPCNVGRTVAAAAVGDDDPADEVARYRGHDVADRGGFVVGRDDDGDGAGQWRHR